MAFGMRCVFFFIHPFPQLFFMSLKSWFFFIIVSFGFNELCSRLYLLMELDPALKIAHYGAFGFYFAVVWFTTLLFNTFYKWLGLCSFGALLWFWILGGTINPAIRQSLQISEMTNDNRFEYSDNSVVMPNNDAALPYHEIGEMCLNGKLVISKDDKALVEKFRLEALKLDSSIAGYGEKITADKNSVSTSKDVASGSSFFIFTPIGALGTAMATSNAQSAERDLAADRLSSDNLSKEKFGLLEKLGKMYYDGELKRSASDTGIMKKVISFYAVASRESGAYYNLALEKQAKLDSAFQVYFVLSRQWWKFQWKPWWNLEDKTVATTKSSPPGGELFYPISTPTTCHSGLDPESKANPFSA